LTIKRAITDPRAKSLITERDPDTINMGDDDECKTSNTANTAADRK
jgi:hypothetical protein